MKEELKTYYVGAGISEKSANKDIQKLLDSRLATLGRAEDLWTKSRDQAAVALGAYYQKNYRRKGDLSWDCTLALGAKLGENLPSSRQPEGCPDFSGSPAELKELFEKNKRRMDAVGTACRNGNSHCKNYVETEGGGRWSPSVLENYVQARNSFFKTQESVASTRRLQGTLRSINSLEFMVETQDFNSMAEYARILECEETPLSTRP
jgi:hypothetical protein